MRLPPLVDLGPELTRAEVERYSRHVLLPGLGADGQRRLRNARVCVVGAGGLGSPVLEYLAAAGVGVLGVVDDDVVTASNLQRQVLHSAHDLGRLKVDSARDRIERLAPGVRVVTHPLRLTARTADLLADYDVVVDGSDNFPTRYLVNDACARLGLPEVWGSVLRFDAQVSVFWARPPGDVPGVQLRDVFPEPPEPGAVPSCAEAGVLGAMCGQVGSVMATEVVKLVAGIGEPLLGRVLVVDALSQRWTEIPVAPASGTGPGSLRPDGPARGSHGEAAAVRSVAADVPQITPDELADALRGPRPPVVVDLRDASERAAAPLPGSVAHDLPAALSGHAPEGLAAGSALVIVCRAGVRSVAAADALRRRGFDAVHLAGGMAAWLEARGSVR